jgi:hypothetical protein
MKSLILPLLLFTTKSSYANNNVERMDNCESNDMLACFNLGKCQNGEKPYETLLGGSVADLTPKTIRNMYCNCPDDKPFMKKGVSGLHCETSFVRCEDDTICFNQGYCEKDSYQDKYHCACKTSRGFAGKSCEARPTNSDGTCGTDDPFYELMGYPWFCVNNGKCIKNETDLKKKCECEPGFAGLHCEFYESEYDEAHCKLDCNGHGHCKKGAKDLSLYIEYGLDIDGFLGGSNVNGDHCICDEGYTGVNCEMEAKKDNFRHCGKGFCFNGGICVGRETAQLEIKDFFCDCEWETSGVAGEFCEHDGVEFCPFPEGHDPSMYYCANGGECPGGQPHEDCDCKEGWTGSRCEVKIEYVEEYKERNDCDLQCENGGSCFFGDHPLQDDTVKAIPGLEFLQDNKHCRCPQGYIGLRCEMRYQRCGNGEHYCLHGSDCVSDNDQFTCDCNEASTKLVAYAGHYCEHTAREFCAGPGAGKHSFCTEHGTCRGEVGIGQDHVGCDCDEGWTGDFCEYELEQLRTNGVATRTFTWFIAILIGVICFLATIFFIRSKRNNTVEYETTAVNETHVNPYGDNEDDDDEYVLKDVRIM